MDRKCDGTPDCPGGEDENNCGGGECSKRIFSLLNILVHKSLLIIVSLMQSVIAFVLLISMECKFNQLHQLWRDHQCLNINKNRMRCQCSRILSPCSWCWHLHTFVQLQFRPSRRVSCILSHWPLPLGSMGLLPTFSYPQQIDNRNFGRKQ